MQSGRTVSSGSGKPIATWRNEFAPDKTAAADYSFAMSATEILNELPKLTEAERRAVLNKLRELAHEGEDSRACNATAEQQAAALDRVEEEAVAYHTIDLPSRGISEAQAADLRARLKTFAEDWERPEAAIYDEDPAR